MRLARRLDLEAETHASSGLQMGNVYG